MQLFLSPHFDDAVLSCGGTIDHLAKTGETVIVRTVMGQKPHPERVPDTAIVRELHSRWESSLDAVKVRIQEDEEAVRTLGAEPQRMTVWPDCVYRVSRVNTALYPSEESLFGSIHADDLAGQLIPTIVLPAREIVHTLYAPLGVGNHVDHQIVRNWALELKRQNPLLALKFYEEYPYCENKHAVDRALLFYKDKQLDLNLEVAPVNEDAAEAKMRAIACYRSQISTFWENMESMRQSTFQYMLRAGNGIPAERFWSLG